MQNTAENTARDVAKINKPAERTREQVLAEILDDAAQSPEDYARDSVVPEGGE